MRENASAEITALKHDLERYMSIANQAVNDAAAQRGEIWKYVCLVAGRMRSEGEHDRAQAVEMLADAIERGDYRAPIAGE